MNEVMDDRSLIKKSNTDEEDSFILGSLFNNPEVLDRLLNANNGWDHLWLAPSSEELLRSNNTLADERVKAWKRVGDILSTNPSDNAGYPFL